ncbi:uncharacterized protein [Dendropsophus ebraccatus]|uniref:uncharacterized protein n=1 Tax=Dendropsophus ebraccatus TaxID=150705 RepID=UPI003831CFEC
MKTGFIMILLLHICVHTILIASANCLSCEMCESADSMGPIDCNGYQFRCGENQTCFTLHMSTYNIQESRLSRVYNYVVNKQCWDHMGCQCSGKISSPSHKMTFITDCCGSEMCRTPLPTLPPENNTHNGLVCPAASTFLETKFEPTYAMKCTGDEEYCFEFTSNKAPNVYMAGCASYWYCYLIPLIGEFYLNNAKLKVVQTCTKANRTSSLPVVNSLLCWQCQGSINIKCEHYAVCSAENVACVTVISETSYGGKTTTQLMKRCGYSTECNSTGIITTAQGRISRNTTCCYSDNCISPTPTLPSENNETNGLICDSCYLKDHGSCTGRDGINCTGNATQCISYTQKVIEGTFTSSEILHGCAHPSICDSGNINVTYGDKILQETKICSIPAKSSVHPPNILLPPENNTHNGLVCPAASTFLQKVYEPTYAMKCTGDEQYCFEFTSSKPQSPY